MPIESALHRVDYGVDTPRFSPIAGNLLLEVSQF